MKDDIVGEAGAGLVKIVFNFKGQPLRVEIDDMIFAKDDKQLISDLFVAALNNGLGKVRANAIEILSKNKMPSIQDLFGELLKSRD